MSNEVLSSYRGPTRQVALPAAADGGEEGRAFDVVSKYQSSFGRAAVKGASASIYSRKEGEPISHTYLGGLSL